MTIDVAPAGVAPQRSTDHWVLAVGPEHHLARVAATLPSTWWDRRRGVLLAADGGEVSVVGDRAAVVRGQLREVGRPWTDAAALGPRVAVGGRPRPYGDPLDGLTGDGAAAVVDVDGRGSAAADHMGSAGLYVGRGRGVDVVATRPGLVAEALAAVGVTVGRDPRAGAWLALAGTLIADASSFVGVDRLPPGSMVVVSDGRCRVQRRLPWRSPEGLEGLDDDELVDVAEETIVDHLREALALDQGRPTIDLTGGKDSRALLAVALHRFAIDDFRVRTVGAPDGVDVRAAANIAAHLGFTHESGIDIRQRTDTFGDRATQFVHATEGLHTAWWMVHPTGDPPLVRLSGTSGELVRAVGHEEAWLGLADRPAEPTVGAVGDFVLRRYRRGTAGFLRPEVEAELEEQLRGRLRVLVDDGVPTDELIHAHVAGYHAFYLGGLRLDRETDLRVRPLADPTVVRTGHARGPVARFEERIHLGLIRRASGILAALPVTPDDWNAPGELPPVPALPANAPTDAPAVEPAGLKGAGYSTLGLAATRPNDERRAFVTDALADPDSGIWEVADRDRVLAAVDGFDELRMKPRQQLYALATGAVWLAGG